MDVIGSDAAYATAWVVGSVACVMLLNRVLATNRKMPKVAKPFGVVKDGILWNATTVGACAGPETIDGASTVHELMELAFSQWSSESAAGKRPLLKRYYEEIKPGQTVEKLTFADEYVFTSYSQYKEQMADLASGMVAFAKLKPGDKVIIYAETQLEWMLAALAAFTQSLTVVTIYATLGEEGLAHGLSQTKAKLIIADAKLLPKVSKAVTAAGKEMASCKHVVYIGDPVKEHDEKGAAVTKQTLAGLTSTGWSAQELAETMSFGRANPMEPTPPQPGDIAVIMYTSGTTGLPKGVVISHSNIVHAVVGTKERLLTYLPDGKMAGHIFQAYLPLAHIMEMVLEIACLSHGVICGYGNPHTLTPAGIKLKTGTCLGDAATLRPTIMVFAPAILDKVQVALNAKISSSSPIVQTLFKWGLAAGESNFQKGVVGAPWYYNKIVFKKVQTLLGGRVIFAATGSAPLAPQTQRFAQTAFNAPCRQGYGLTETCATSCIQIGCDNSSGVVGPPVSSVAIKLLDWAEGNYLNTDEQDPAIGMRRGEVLIGGPTVCMGYLVDPAKPDPDVIKKNKEDFSVDKDGMRWFHTGDIGQINKDGSLQIIDRKKDLVKLQQGEYVALSKVESALKSCPLVEVPLCYGRSSESFCVALVCPVSEQLKALGDEMGLHGKSHEELCADPKVAAEVTKRCQAACKGKLVGFEIPKKVGLVADTWTPENDLLTAAMKLKRVPICKKHAAQLDALYK